MDLEQLHQIRVTMKHTPTERVKLRPGDLLIIDSPTMLHFRSALSGGIMLLDKHLAIVIEVSESRCEARVLVPSCQVLWLKLDDAWGVPTVTNVSESASFVHDDLG